ncbi:MAG: TRAP transporter small permease subunit [Candidatus Rokubacteria bacterium]|nr:TRAP transporter small permease subunit [Candidatus Rokubacteria bacterium]
MNRDALLEVTSRIDAIGRHTGTIVGVLILPLVVALTYEVFARYAFHAPTVWAYDISYMLYGAHFMLGAGYTLLRGGHIRTDILYQKWSPRTQGVIDAALYLFLFFPGIIFFFVMGFIEAWQSWSMGESSDASPWRPPLYPLKAVIPLTALLLLLQGVSELLKSLYVARTGRRL